MVPVAVPCVLVVLGTGLHSARRCHTNDDAAGWDCDTGVPTFEGTYLKCCS